MKGDRKEHLLKDSSEKKQAEEALRQSEELLRLIANQVSIVLWTTDTELKFISSTGAGLDALGLKTDQVVGMTLFEYLQTDDPENLVIEAHKQAIQGNDAKYEFEWEGRVFDCRVTPLNNKEGLVIGTLGFALDITDRKNVEEALRESRERFRGLVEITSDWIWEVDENAVYTYVSPKVHDILGYEPDEILGKTPFSLMPPDEAKRVAAIFGPIAASQKPFKELENTNLHKDGHHVILETSGVPIVNVNGKFCGYRGIDRDITDRKQAENTLRMRARELKESNIALKVLLMQRENDKGELEENILSNIKHLIIPYIEKLKKNRSMSEELAYLNIIESNLNEIISPFSLKLSSIYVGLTPKEIQIADLTKDGKQDKEISELLNIAIDTVKFHKKNIRKKVGIYGKGTNLRSYLLSSIK